MEGKKIPQKFSLFVSQLTFTPVEKVYQTSTNAEMIWDTVELLVKGTQFVIWSREDGISLLDLNSESNPDDICPEGEVTKQFWRTLYEGIEHWR
jgi:hypothetical protein